ncbi:MAG TPA: hypothetical protein VES38_10515 [Methylotenera sp.]|nr:hypothetical protein [Methylotenera sp.]
MNKLTCALLTIGLSLTTYSIWAADSYEFSRNDDSILTPTSPGAINRDPRVNPDPSDIRRMMEESEAKEKAEKEKAEKEEEELRREAEKNMKK